MTIGTQIIATRMVLKGLSLSRCPSCSCHLCSCPCCTSEILLVFGIERNELGLREFLTYSQTQCRHTYEIGSPSPPNQPTDMHACCAVHINNSTRDHVIKFCAKCASALAHTRPMHARSRNTGRSYPKLSPAARMTGSPSPHPRPPMCSWRHGSKRTSLRHVAWAQWEWVAGQSRHAFGRLPQGGWHDGLEITDACKKKCSQGAARRVSQLFATFHLDTAVPASVSE